MSEVTPMAALAAALAKANAQIHNPGFDKVNPHFKSKFASLAAVRNAVVPEYARNGLSIIQDLQSVEGGVACFTRILHEAGGELTLGPLVMPVTKQDAQGYASAGTYAKRVHLQGVACVVGDDDDDGENAVGRTTGSENIAKRGVTTVDPRGDLAGKSDPQAVAKWVEQVKTALASDPSRHAPLIHYIHTELCSDEGLYIDVCDELDRSGVIGKGKWKEMVRHGNPKQIKKAS